MDASWTDTIRHRIDADGLQSGTDSKSSRVAVTRGMDPTSIVMQTRTDQRSVQRSSTWVNPMEIGGTTLIASGTSWMS